MAGLAPFRALRPSPSTAARVAAVPYDVVNTDEARALAAGNPLSFLHVSRPEIDLPPGTDLHGDDVYATGVEELRAAESRGTARLSRRRRDSTSIGCAWAVIPRSVWRGAFPSTITTAMSFANTSTRVATRKTTAPVICSTCGRKPGRCSLRIERGRRSMDWSSESRPGTALRLHRR